MSTTSQTQLVVDRSNANELLKINFNVRFVTMWHARLANIVHPCVFKALISMQENVRDLRTLQPMHPSVV